MNKYLKNLFDVFKRKDKDNNDMPSIEPIETIVNYEECDLDTFKTLVAVDFYVDKDGSISIKTDTGKLYKITSILKADLARDLSLIGVVPAIFAFQHEMQIKKLLDRITALEASISKLESSKQNEQKNE